MHKTLSIALLILIVPIVAIAQKQPEGTQINKDLIGKWTIDLRPTPESDGYYQTFFIESTDKNTFTGTFYGSIIENALINKNWDKLYFAFSTSDQNNEYYHSGFLENGKLYGITYCSDREFVAPWTGVIK